MLRRVKEVAVQAGLQIEFDLKTFRPTFERRRTDLPKGTPFALTPEFLQSKTKAAEWIGFVERLRLENLPDRRIQISSPRSAVVAPDLRCRG